MFQNTGELHVVKLVLLNGSFFVHLVDLQKGIRLSVDTGYLYVAVQRNIGNIVFEHYDSKCFELICPENTLQLQSEYLGKYTSK